MGEYLRDSLDSIWAHKMRSILTMLGIIIGIASIIAISSTIMGTNEQIKQNLVGAGNNVVTVKLYQGNYEMEYDWNPVPEGIPSYNPGDRETIMTIPNAEDCSFYMSRNAWQSVYHGATGLSMGTIYGIDDHYMSVYGYIIRAGRNFIPDDFERNRKVALIDSNVSETLFNGENPVGKTIEIKGEPFVVIGEFAEPTSFQPTINSMEDYQTYTDMSGGHILVPMQTWPVIYQYDEPPSVAIRARATEDMTDVGNQATILMNARFTKDTGDVKYKSDDILKKAKDLQDLSTATNKQLIWIASISLLVGGIGVMNIMLVSVSERTQEIGLMKALGAKRRVISMQFLMEAGILTCLGGIIGVLVGIALAFVVSKASSVPIFISVPVMGLAVVFSFVVGLFFGAFPATQAAKLNPIDALRRE